VKATPPTRPGVCRWLARAENGNRRININGVIYEVEEGANGLVLSYQKGSQTVRYAIDTTGEVWICDCSDARYRWNRPGGGCKHVRALQAAYAVLQAQTGETP